MEKYYRHFKGGLYKFIGIAKDSETLEERVVYQAMYGDRQLWVRPAEMFFGKVDRDGKVQVRFQEVTIVDEHFKDAARLMVQSRNGLRSNLQRKLAISYARAGRILEQLASAGIIAPMEGKLPCEILIPDLAALEPILSRYEPLPQPLDGAPSLREMDARLDELFREIDSRE